MRPSIALSIEDGASTTIPARAHGLAHDPVTSLVVPRPIGWITTIGQVRDRRSRTLQLLESGHRTQAAVVMFSTRAKHSQRNTETAGEFVFDLVNSSWPAQMNQTGAEVDETISEAETAGLAMARSRVVKPRRVARSAVALDANIAGPWCSRTRTESDRRLGGDRGGPSTSSSTMASSSMACSMFGVCVRSLGSATWTIVSLTIYSLCSGTEPELVQDVPRCIERHRIFYC